MKTIKRLLEQRNNSKKFRTVENTVRDVLTRMVEQRSKVEKDQSDQIVAGTYKTKNFEVSPAAQKLFTQLPKGTSPNDAEHAATHHDELFALVKQSMAKERSTAADVEEAEHLVKMIRMLGQTMKVDDKMGYLDDVISQIKSYQKPDEDTFDNPTPEMIKKRFTSPPMSRTKEPDDRDMDNSKFLISRNIKAQRKLKIIDAD
jgi:hypothetical protein